LFASCGNGDEDEDDDSGNSGNNTGGNTGGNNPGPMNPQGANVYFENSTFPISSINADVFMLIEGYWNSEDDYFEMVLPTPIGRITDGKLSFTLPNVSAYADKGRLLAEELSYYNNRPSGHTETETSEYSIWTFTVTKNTMEAVIPQDTKGFEGEIGFVHEGKEYWLSYGYETTGLELGVNAFLYSNKPGTLKGEFNTTVVSTYTYNGNTETYNSNETYNCTFTAGWNVIYGIGTDTGGGPSSTSTSTVIFSTNPPANAATMRWIAYTYD
jgi:hypothetical protein